MEEIKSGEVLLKVDHLGQHFGSLKAVDDVSFDIKKGEVFGLVGESGCGKTTTGRSIIKIYDITSGSIYFKGQRICAGTYSYVQEIKALQKDSKANPENKAKNNERIAELREEIKKAKFDHKNSDKVYSKSLVERLTKVYEEKLANASEEDKPIIERQ